MTLYYIPQKKTTTLSTIGGIDASQTTGITLTSVSNVDISAPGIVCLTWSNPISDSLYEYVSYTSISGSNELVGVTRGAENSTGRTHSNGATVAWVYSASHINNINDLLTGVTGGALLKNEKKNIITTAGGTTTYTLTPSPAITAYATGQEFVIKMNATNTGASTINVSALGAKSLTKSGATALASGDLLIDAVYKIVYDGTQFQVSGIQQSTVTLNRAFAWYLDGTSVTANEVGAKYIAPQAMTSVRVSAKTVSGTATIRIQKGTTDIVNSISVTSTIGHTTSFSSGAIAQYDVITLDITADSSCVGLTVTFECSQP